MYEARQHDYWGELRQIVAAREKVGLSRWSPTGDAKSSRN